MRGLLLLNLMLLCRLVPQAQNLLANGAFEDENICTEYKKNCAPEAWISTSLTSNYYFDAAQWAHSGSHFVGLIAGHKTIPFVRTFIRSRLLCGMRAGHQYRIRLAIRSRHNLFDSIGVYFSPTDFLFETKRFSEVGPVKYFADSAGKTLEPSEAWQQLTMDYTATGKEIFFSLGSFKKEERRYRMPPEYKNCYYFYLDDISITPLDPHEQLCNDADSMRNVLYNNQDERHQLLDSRIRFYKKNVPVESLPPETRIQHIDTLIIPDILFATGSARLHEKSNLVLDSFCTELAAKKVDSLVVAGHTDSVGKLAYNTQLSADRAAAVAGYIRNRAMLSPELVHIYYYAFLRPVATNSTTAGRQRNRRVGIYLYSHE